MTTATRTEPHRGLAVFLAVVAGSAYGGVVGLLTGAIDMGSTITDRLPFESSLVAGLALLLVVAMPTTLAAIAAWQGVRQTGDLVAVAGLMLVGWIVVQVLVIREFSWFQPAYALIGLGLLVAGQRMRRQRSRVTT